MIIDKPRSEDALTVLKYLWKITLPLGVMWILVIEPAINHHPNSMPRAQISRSKHNMQETASALDAFRADRGFYPSAAGAGLEILSELSGGRVRVHNDLFKTRRYVDPHNSSLLEVAPVLFYLLAAYWTFILGACVFTWREKPRKRAMAGIGTLFVGGALLHLVWAAAYNSINGAFSRSVPGASSLTNRGFNYFTDGSGGYILQSLGVYGEPNFAGPPSLGFNEVSTDTLRIFLSPFTYDPTNGAISPGDLFHIGVSSDSPVP